MKISNNKIEIRINQSQVRVRSGIKLVLFSLLATICFLLLGPKWLAKLCGGLMLFFTAVTLLEFWNVWRLKQKLS
jgi:hypothetical protein